jgi:hypothetical protein
MVSHVKQEETSHIDDILSLEMPIGDYAEICPIEFQRKNNNFTVRSQNVDTNLTLGTLVQ